MREFFADENNQAVVETLDVPAQVTQKCQASFNQAEAVAICQRSSLAGKNLATLFWAVSSFGNKPNFHTPDTTEVEQTKQTHPEPQCRLDTYFQGSLCDKEKSEPISNNNASKGYCTRHDHYLQGTRPLCWYRPNEFNF